jgi:hypothetical protein
MLRPPKFERRRESFDVAIESSKGHTTLHRARERIQAIDHTFDNHSPSARVDSIVFSPRRSQSSFHIPKRREYSGCERLRASCEAPPSSTTRPVPQTASPSPTMPAKPQTAFIGRVTSAGVTPKAATVKTNIQKYDKFLRRVRPPRPRNPQPFPSPPSPLPLLSLSPPLSFPSDSNPPLY